MLDRIIQYPDPRLRKRAVEEDDTLVATILLEASEANEGGLVGLSSIQIGESGRALTYIDDDGEWRAMVNPIVVERSNEHRWDIEGCASLPGVRVLIRRPQQIKVEYVDHLTKAPCGVTLREMSARVVLHEIDHLDGVMIIDHGEPILESDV